MSNSASASTTSLPHPPPPPPYSAIESPPPLLHSPPVQPRVQAQPPRRLIPSINLLLLGSPGVGKSTFISRLPYVRDGRLQTPTSLSSSSSPSSSSPASIPNNPSDFSVSLFNRPYNISLYRSTSALFIDPFPEKIDALILCYAVDDRVSFFNMTKYWSRVFQERYDEVPRMVLGLKRDERHAMKRRRRRGMNESDIDGEEMETGRRGGNGRGEQQRQGYHHEVGGGEGEGEDMEYICIMPEEGLEAAKDLQCDRYAECSALTGELMWEVLEDITRMAAGTTTDTGGFSQGEGCVVI